MKLTKKKVFVTALAVCLIAILSFGTIAWFTASDEVTNQFKVTTSDEEGTPDFSVDLFEHKVNPDTGDRVSNEEVETNTYNNVLPGSELDKDPTARNTGSYDQWIRVKVTLNNYDVWCDALNNGNLYDFSEILKGIGTEWSHNPVTDRTFSGDGKTATFTYYLNSPLLAAKNNGGVAGEATLFTSVEIPSGFTVDNMKFNGTEDGVFNLNVVAEAVQRENIADSCRDAFAIIDGQ